MAGSSFDTLLAVYTGTTVDALTLVARNDDCTPGVRTSCATFNVVPGTNYFIQIMWAKPGSAMTNATVVVAATQAAVPAPSNDLFSKALTTFPAAVSTIGATLEAGEPTYEAASGSVWYNFTAAAGSIYATVSTT